MTTIELAHRAEPATPPGRPAPLADTASITTFGTFAWLGWLWAVVAVAFGLTMVGVTIWGGEPDHSIWEPFAAGWQRWPIAGAGFTTIVVFAPIFVVNGMTRTALGRSAWVTGAALSISGAVYVLVGFLAERAVYDANDWTHLGGNDRPVSDAGWATLLLVFLLGHAAYFVSGWLAGIAYNRLGGKWFVALLPPAAVPAAVAELLLSRFGTGNNEVDVLGRVGDPGLWIAAPVTTAVVVAAAVLAARWTRSVTVA